MTNRVICWFSCGAASAVAAKYALEKYPGAEIVYIHIEEEHEDSQRFRADCENWLGRKIKIIQDEKYAASTKEVWKRTRYMAGIAGASCTRALKKQVREEYQRATDLHIMGYTLEEQDRVDRFIDANPDIEAEFPLIEAGLDKANCLAIIERAGIELPMMYRLGFHNNNCIGCVKGGNAYWAKILDVFTERYEEISKIEETLGVKLLKITENGKQNRISLKDFKEKNYYKNIWDWNLWCHRVGFYVNGR